MHADKGYRSEMLGETKEKTNKRTVKQYEIEWFGFFFRQITKKVLLMRE